MATSNQVYVGTRDTRTGMIVPSGCKCNSDGTGLRYVGIPRNVAPMTNAQARAAGIGILMTPGQIADALATATSGNGSLLASQFQATDTPGRGANAISRAEKPGGISGAGTTYTIIFKNDNALAVSDYRIFGDVTGTYTIAQSLVPTPGSTLTIDGSAGTLSLSHLTSRAAYRPIKVSYIQIRSVNDDYFTQNPVTYFDTEPNPRSGVTQQLLGLSTLVSPEQYHPNIQFYSVPEMFDGVNGLRVNVPIDEVVTMTFSIASESRARLMNLLD